MKIKISDAFPEGMDNHVVVKKSSWLKEKAINRALNLLGITSDISQENNLLMDCFNILIWNCRGAGNDRFERNFSDLMSVQKPQVVDLLETKVSLDAIGLFFKTFGLTTTIHVDPMGKIGGIWVLWDPTKVSVNTTHVNSQAIHVKVKKDGHVEWMFSAVYASPNPRIRELHMEEVPENLEQPWLVAGDFSDTASRDESKTTAPDTSSSQRRKFADKINKCNLFDMGFNGPKFTWSNGRQGLANVQKRLDRALCNEEWRALFPEGTIQTLPRTYSDHSPTLIHILGKKSVNKPNRPFRFKAAWILDPSFEGVVSNEWKGVDFFDHTKNFTAAALKWNENVFGNIFREKKWVLSRIVGTQKSQEKNYCHNLQLLERDLVTDYNNILSQEKTLWFQKSRAKWITSGEKNT